MTKSEAKSIVSWLKSKNVNARVFEGYSGSLLHGETTTGVATTNVEKVKEAIEELDLGIDVTVDSLGFSKIIY